MEEKNEIEEISCQQEDSIDEKQSQDEKVISTAETKQSLEDAAKEENYGNGVELTIEVQAMEEGKAGESQKRAESPKKLKAGSKRIEKTKITVPQPFSLATEKRMGRARRGSMDFDEQKRQLSKSLSLNYKANAQNSVKAGGSSGMRFTNSNSTTNGNISPRPKNTATGRIDTRVEVKEVEAKKAQSNTKGKEKVEVNKFGNKSSTFKASPLPSFYHRKDHPPPKPDIKKIPVNRPKSPLVGQRNKSTPNSEQKQAEAKGKGVPRSISSTAKETISKLFGSSNRKKPPGLVTQKTTSSKVISSSAR